MIVRSQLTPDRFDDRKMTRCQSRNLVSCCHDCNSKKKQRPADELLRWLFRERRLSPVELRSRLRALCGLKAGKLVPQITQGK